MEKEMKKLESGFTLIELVIVIVILGILAATALPRFVDLTGDANQAAVDGFAGAINGGNSINFATYLARRTGTGAAGQVDDASDAIVVDTELAGCTTAVANLLLQENMPAGYAVTGPAGPIGWGANVTCSLALSGAFTTTFTLTGAD